jgi:hypothetical protein
MPKKAKKKQAGFLGIAREVVEAAIGEPLTAKKARKKVIKRTKKSK